MKRSLIIIIPIILLSKELKIGFVESNRIFLEYQATASATNQFNEYVNMYRDSAATLQKNVEKYKLELEAQKLLLSEEARLKKLDEIEGLTKAYNQFLQDVFGARGRIEQKNDELMAPLLKKINYAVAKIAQQEGFAIVLDLSEGVFYASSELNLTDLVINELNREYGPQTLPTGETKKTIGIFPLREENTEAFNAELGQKCQSELYNAIASFSQKYTVVSKSAINAEFYKRGLGRNIDESQAFIIGLALLCDYIIIGKATQFGTKIEYTITLKNTRTRDTILQKTSSVTEEIKLTESLNNDLRALLAELEKK